MVAAAGLATTAAGIKGRGILGSISGGETVPHEIRWAQKSTKESKSFCKFVPFCG